VQLEHKRSSYQDAQKSRKSGNAEGNWKNTKLHVYLLEILVYLKAIYVSKEEDNQKLQFFNTQF